ncbi:hypothetical protein R6G99_05995 [Actinotignum timonense]|nr:hypothetical protein [Actinotignum timonense]
MARSRSGDIVASLTRDIDRIEVVYAHTVAPVVCASVGIYTTSSDIDAFLDALSQVRGYFWVEG